METAGGRKERKKRDHFKVDGERRENVCVCVCVCKRERERELGFIGGKEWRESSLSIRPTQLLSTLVNVQKKGWTD